MGISNLYFCPGFISLVQLEHLSLVILG